MSYEFLSHSDPKKPLGEHLVEVAKSAKKLVATIKGLDKEQAYLAGLFHDFGKLNPHYQEAFSKKIPPRNYEGGFAPFHSVFSVLVVMECLDFSKIDDFRVINSISGHHTRLSRKPYLFEDWAGQTKKSAKFQNTIDSINLFLPSFFEQMRDSFDKSILADSKIAWHRDPTVYIEDKDKTFEYFLQSHLFYSSLLQADRGSFKEWTTPQFELDFYSRKLITEANSNELSQLREKFNESIFSGNDFCERMFVLEAPTGIGKTKIFLDIINRISKESKFERVFYFSPLLALTDDFEEKVSRIVPKDKITVYNHIFKGSLEEKAKAISTDPELEEGPDGFEWDFKIESFNKEFIVTTTQRLLMTLFSNRASDKMKLLSLKNSLLVVDEVQTIPKSILPSFINLLSILTEIAGTRVIFVSATVPPHFDNIPRLSFDIPVRDRYLKKTEKVVKYGDGLPDELPTDGKTIFMYNTRKAALESPIESDFYVTSGVRKCDRIDMIKRIKNGGACKVVSTQVLEAGVDVSFDNMFRELAPLDNVVQAMGRLNREAEHKNSVLHVVNLGNGYLPYSKLEYNLSRAFLEGNPETSSQEMLSYLVKSYYPQLFERDLRADGENRELSRLIENQLYGPVWDFVRGRVSTESFSVLVPKTEEELSELTRRMQNKQKINSHYLTMISAQFPRSAFRKNKHLFNSELAEKEVFLPLEGILDDFYDRRVGLDKWIAK